MTVFLIKGLNRRLILNKSDNHFAVLRRGSFLNDNNIAVQNACVYHTLAPDFKSEKRLVIRASADIRNITLNLLNSQNRNACRNRTDKRNLGIIVLRLVANTHGTLEHRVTLYKSCLFEGVKVSLHRRGRFQTDRSGNFTHRGRNLAHL